MGNQDINFKHEFDLNLSDDLYSGIIQTVLSAYNKDYNNRIIFDYYLYILAYYNNETIDSDYRILGNYHKYYGYSKNGKYVTIIKFNEDTNIDTSDNKLNFNTHCTILSSEYVDGMMLNVSTNFSANWIPLIPNIH